MNIQVSSSPYAAAHNPYQRFSQPYAVQPAQAFPLTSYDNKNGDVASLQFGSRRGTAIRLSAAVVLAAIFAAGVQLLGPKPDIPANAISSTSPTPTPSPSATVKTTTLSALLKEQPATLALDSTFSSFDKTKIKRLDHGQAWFISD